MDASHDAAAVVPPDTKVLQWGTYQGPAERLAYDACIGEIAEAVSFGKLASDDRHWVMRCAEITEHTLESGWLNKIHAERVAGWAHDRQEALGRRHTTLSAQLRDPVTVPANPMPSLRWLLDRTAEGIDLTVRHELPRNLVVEAVSQFRWHDQIPGILHREYDVFPLRHLHELAHDHIGAVFRAPGPRLQLTATGLRMIADRELLHETAAQAILGGQSGAAPRAVPADVGLAIREAALTSLLALGPREADQLLGSVCRQLEAAGWPVEHADWRLDEAARREIAELRHRLWALDLLYFPGTWTSPLILNEAGTIAVRAALRARAIQPRRHGTSTAAPRTLPMASSASARLAAASG